MLKQIHLKNFQSHSDSSLEFHTGVNCIIGASDQGKSAIMRSLHAVIYNRPCGEDMVSDWIKDSKGKIKKNHEMRVILHNDTHVIERFRNEQNGYVVNGERMEAIRMEIPKSVSDALNIGDVNVQKQMDAPFLISSSGGDVARFINKMIDLEEIDTYLSTMDSFIKECNRNTKNNIVVLGELQDSISQLSWIDSLAPMLEEIELCESIIMRDSDIISIISKNSIEHEESNRISNTSYNFIMKIGSILSDLKKLDQTITVLAGQYNDGLKSTEAHVKQRKNLSLSEGLEQLSEIYSQIQTLDVELNKQTPINALQASLSQYKANIQQANSEDSQLILVTGKLKTIDARLHSILEQTDIVKSAISTFGTETKRITKWDTEINELESSRPETCSTCGRAYEHKTCGK